MVVKPSEQEEEYFARMEYEKRKLVEHAKNMKLAKAERERLKKLHLMRCPKCGMELINIDYRGIEVDKCGECQGIWLDAGEFEAGYNLDRNIIEKLFAVFKK